VMLQTRASISADLPVITKKFSGCNVLLYADVDSLNQVENSIKNAEVIVPRRKTSYGASEIWIKEPSGTIIGFAEFSQEQL
jgi:hypothetical protein